MMISVLHREENIVEKVENATYREETIVEKVENAGYQHFLFFPQCF